MRGWQHVLVAAMVAAGASVGADHNDDVTTELRMRHLELPVQGLKHHDLRDTDTGDAM